MERARVETLEYETATKEGKEAPLGAIVVATLVFAGANWITALATDYYYVVGRRVVSADPGEASVQLSLRLEKLTLNMVPETVSTVIAAAVVLCVQWWAWRAWPADRRSAWVVAAGGGDAHCAGRWGHQWLMRVGPESLTSFGVAVAFVLGLAAGVGVILAWWRGR